MHRFVIFGRGRSGTTVVTDELGLHPQIAVPNEDYVVRGVEWDLLEPFERIMLVGVDASAQHLLEGPAPLPFDPWCIVRGVDNSPAAYGQYLDVLEAWGTRQEGALAFGFKIIDSQLLEREGLIDELCRRGYRIVNVHRRNVIRLALSGLIANARGVFNERNFRVPDESYEIDPNEFVQAINDIVHWTRYWDQEIAQRKMRSIDVDYEMFLADREAFYAPILRFLGVELQVPADSSFTRMTPRDLSHTIRNYEQIEAVVKYLGREDLLVQL